MISNTNYDFQGSGEQGSVVMKFTQIDILYIYIHIIPWLFQLLTIIIHRLTIDSP